MASCSKPEKDKKLVTKLHYNGKRSLEQGVTLIFMAKTSSIFDAMYPVSEKSK